MKYTLPLLGGAIFQQLYTLADTIIAGRFAGQTALTAIGASNAIVNILMAFALGANAGCAVLAARYFGKKDNADVKTTIYTALIAFAVFSIVLMGAGVVTCRLTLDALKTPQEAMNESVTYLNIYYYGLPFLMLYNLGTGIFFCDQHRAGLFHGIAVGRCGRCMSDLHCAGGRVLADSFLCFPQGKKIADCARRESPPLFVGCSQTSHPAFFAGDPAKQLRFGRQPLYPGPHQ